MNYENIEAYLEDIGEKELMVLRPVLTNPASTYTERLQVLRTLQDFNVFMQGFMYCIALADSIEKARYYMQYLDQARSKKGLNGERP